MSMAWLWLTEKPVLFTAVTVTILLPALLHSNMMVLLIPPVLVIGPWSVLSQVYVMGIVTLPGSTEAVKL